MGNSITVRLIEKLSNGELKTVDERGWSMEMVEALHHINYITFNERQYETLEGRLNIDQQVMELLIIAVQNE
ncbi:hypothetical protein AB6A23_12355 [Paenibacillus tarimensis]